MNLEYIQYSYSSQNSTYTITMSIIIFLLHTPLLYNHLYNYDSIMQQQYRVIRDEQAPTWPYSLWMTLSLPVLLSLTFSHLLFVLWSLPITPNVLLFLIGYWTGMIIGLFIHPDYGFLIFLAGIIVIPTCSICSIVVAFFWSQALPTLTTGLLLICHFIGGHFVKDKFFPNLLFT